MSARPPDFTTRPEEHRDAQSPNPPRLAAVNVLAQEPPALPTTDGRHAEQRRIERRVDPARPACDVEGTGTRVRGDRRVDCHLSGPRPEGPSADRCARGCDPRLSDRAVDTDAARHRDRCGHETEGEPRRRVRERGGRHPSRTPDGTFDDLGVDRPHRLHRGLGDEVTAARGVRHPDRRSARCVGGVDRALAVDGGRPRRSGVRRATQAPRRHVAPRRRQS